MQKASPTESVEKAPLTGSALDNEGLYSIYVPVSHVHKSLLLGQGDQPHLDDEASDDNLMSTTDSRLPDSEQSFANSC